MSNDFFALPPFRPTEAMTSLERTLRDLKLTKRGAAFEWHSRAVLQIELGVDHIAVRLAKRPAISPQWESQRLVSPADVRRFVDTVRKRLGAWDDRDD